MYYTYTQCTSTLYSIMLFTSPHILTVPSSFTPTVPSMDVFCVLSIYLYALHLLTVLLAVLNCMISYRQHILFRHPALNHFISRSILQPFFHKIIFTVHIYLLSLSLSHVSFIHRWLDIHVNVQDHADITC